MRKLAITALFATIGLAAIPSYSSAMTAAPGATGHSALVQDIAYGCGPGFHPNHWGHCVPNGPALRPAYRPVYHAGPVYRPLPAYRVCPRGTHLGAQGRACHPNGY